MLAETPTKKQEQVRKVTQAFALIASEAVVLVVPSGGGGGTLAAIAAVLTVGVGSSKGRGSRSSSSGRSGLGSRRPCQ